MRTTSALLSLLVTGGLFLGCGSGHAANDGGATNAGPDDLPSRRFLFSYQATIPAPPPGTQRLNIWVPLPMEDPGVQMVSDLRTSAGGYAVSITTEPELGNRMMYVAVEKPRWPLTVGWEAVITRYQDRGQGRLPQSPRYLAANKLIPLGSSAQALARRVGATDPVAAVSVRARRIYDDVLVEMAYDKSVPGYGYGDFERSITICRGNCTDFHARFIGVARAARIPARFTMGIPMKQVTEGTYDSYHCWAHWSDGSRWAPVDISEADKVAVNDPAQADWYFGHLTVDRIALTFGRDVLLEPRQQGEPLNYFVFPYAEADGQPLPLDKSMWSFHYKDV